METTYYMVIDGRQAGPFVREELKYHSLRPETLVWRVGLENWVPASTLPELADLLDTDGTEVELVPPAPPQGEGIKTDPYAAYNGATGGRPAGVPGGAGLQPEQFPGEPIAHTNWLPWAIVTTVLGCITTCFTLILGIVGIVYANKANDFYFKGMRREGDSANSTARTVTIIGLILAALSLAACIVLFATGALQSFIEMAERLD